MFTNVLLNWRWLTVKVFNPAPSVRRSHPYKKTMSMLL